MSITVREVEVIEISIFHDMAERCDSIFCSKTFTNSFGSKLIKFGIFNAQNNLIGGFIALRTKLRGISALIDPSYAPHCGLFAELPEKTGFKKNQLIKDIMLAITTCLQNRNEKIISLSFPPEFRDFQIPSWNGFEVRTKYTYRLALEGDLTSIFENYDPKLRSSLQKYLKGEVLLDHNVTSQELIDQVLRLQKDQKVRKKEDFLIGLINNYISEEKNQFLTCKLMHDAQIANVTFCIHGRSTCYYLLGAINKNVKAKNAGAICLHDSIIRAHQKGLKVFDFEGSSIPAIETFFRSFGGELTTYFNVRKCPPLLRRFLK